MVGQMADLIPVMAVGMVGQTVGINKEEGTMEIAEQMEGQILMIMVDGIVDQIIKMNKEDGTMEIADLMEGLILMVMEDGIVDLIIRMNKEAVATMGGMEETVDPIITQILAMGMADQIKGETMGGIVEAAVTVEDQIPKMTRIVEAMVGGIMGGMVKTPTQDPKRLNGV